MRVGEKKRKRFGLLKYGNLILVAIDPHLGRYFAIEIWFQEWKKIKIKIWIVEKWQLDFDYHSNG
jgi:hypothetical protein